MRSENNTNYFDEASLLSIIFSTTKLHYVVRGTLHEPAEYNLLLDVSPLSALFAVTDAN